jgi:4-hydroxybenzoate polyprenyltransferase
MIDWLRLLRISGLATIASNLAAAVLFAFYAGTGLHPAWLGRLVLSDPGRVAWLVAASVLLYGAGMVWNDLADIERDKIIHPERPLPAGRIPIPAAVVAAALMAVGAVVCALMAEGPIGMLAALTVLLLALLYNLEAKHVPWLGSVVMGLTRAAHACFALLIIGQDALRAALVADDPPGARWLLAYPLALFLYITGVTLISELEHRAGRRWELLAGGALIAAGVAVAVAQLFGAAWPRAWLAQGGGVWPLALAATFGMGLSAAGWLLWRVGSPWFAAVRDASRSGAGRTLIAGLGGIILLDAVVATAAHPLGGLLVLALLPVMGLAVRTVRMD